MRLPSKLQARSGLQVTVERVPVGHERLSERFLVTSTAPGRGVHRATIGCNCRGELVCTRDHVGPYVAKLIRSYRVHDISRAIAARNAARIRGEAAA